MMNWLKQFWPEILAVLALIVDQAVKQVDQLASSHEHTSVIIVVALVLLRRLQTWLSGKKSTEPSLPSPPSTYNRSGRAA